MAEVKPVLPIGKQSQELGFQSCTVTWPQDRSPFSANVSAAPSTAPTPRYKFVLLDLTLKFPPGELSLICGKLGSGKTLLLLGMSLNSITFHFMVILTCTSSFTRRSGCSERADDVPALSG
jgi:ABC-type multidrug transport system fused ATPase/permease subunit